LATFVGSRRPMLDLIAERSILQTYRQLALNKMVAATKSAVSIVSRISLSAAT
jgi:hypothetical protein